MSLSTEDQYKLKAYEEQRLVQKAREGSLLAYTAYTMPRYEINWHHKLMCDFLRKFINREIRRLMFFLPPRYGKTELTSRRLPCVLHGLYPDDEILACSYNSDLAGDNTIDVQRILDTERHRTVFPNSQITPEGRISKYARNSNEHELLPFTNDKGEIERPSGSYRSAGVGGAFTGRGGDWILIDDPIKNRKDASSQLFRDELYKFYSSTLRTRLEGVGSIILTMTRWHNDDLAGRLLKLAKDNPDADQWTVVMLPAIKENEDESYDTRELGDPLWPSKFSLESLASSKASSTAEDWASLYRQTPNIEGGNLVRSDWIKYYGGFNQPPIPRKFDQLIQSWDFASKDKTTSDFNVGQVWGRVGANFYLLWQVRGRWSFPVACKRVIEMCETYPNIGKKLVEGKANGPAIIQTLRDLIPGLVEVEPYGDKVARLNAVAPFYESGNVWYPDASVAPWITDHVTELCNFPKVTNDDQVDAASQALDNLRHAKPAEMPRAGHGSGVIF